MIVSNNIPIDFRIGNNQGAAYYQTTNQLRYWVPSGFTLTDTRSITDIVSAYKFFDGTLILSGTSNPYPGTTDINAGILQINTENALGSGYIRFSGGTLLYGPGITVDISSQNIIKNSTAPIKIDTGTNTVTFSTSMGSTNKNGLTKLGNGTLIFDLNTAQGYTGPTTVAAGILDARVPISTSQYNINSGAELYFRRSGTAVSISHNFVNYGSISYWTNSPSITLLGSISGTGSISQQGTGILILSGNNTYTGSTTINSGKLNLASTNAVGGGGNIIFSGGTLQYSALNTIDLASRIVNSTAPIIIDTNNQNVTYASAITSTNTGGLVKTGAGALTLNAVNSYTGATTISGGTLSVNKLYSGATEKFISALFTPTTLTVNFLSSNPPSSGESYSFFSGATTNTYSGASLTLVGATGRGGIYNSTTSTLSITS